MIDNLPSYISLAFGLTTVATLVLFIQAINRSKTERTRKTVKPILIGLIVWLSMQAVLTYNNLYNTDTNTFPPKIVWIGIMPTILSIIILFASTRGRQFMDSLSLIHLTYLNIVRIPVELILWGLFFNKAIPALMTFEGRNFDILAGISAPFVAYFGLTQTILNRKIVLLWHVISLGLLLNIVVHALLSAPSPIQQFAFDQPNIAILHFPFSWLPTFIVPIVLFAHLASIRQLMNQKKSY